MILSFLVSEVVHAASFSFLKKVYNCVVSI